MRTCRKENSYKIETPKKLLLGSHVGEHFNQLLHHIFFRFFLHFQRVTGFLLARTSRNHLSTNLPKEVNLIVVLLTAGAQCIDYLQ